MSRIPGMILGYVGGGLIILAVILYMIMAPHKFEGVKDIGFGWTFYVVVVGGTIQTIGGDLMRGIKKGSRIDHCHDRGRRDYPHLPRDYYHVRGRMAYPPQPRGAYYNNRSGMDYLGPRKVIKRRVGRTTRKKEVDPVSIIKGRLARGEVTREELMKLRNLIEKFIAKAEEEEIEKCLKAVLSNLTDDPTAGKDPEENRTESNETAPRKIDQPGKETEKEEIIDGQKVIK